MYEIPKSKHNDLERYIKNDCKIDYKKDQIARISFFQSVDLVRMFWPAKDRTDICKKILGIKPPKTWQLILIGSS